MDWNGVLGIVIALGIITLVFWGGRAAFDGLFGAAFLAR
jgi:hypothetical protein